MKKCLGIIIGILLALTACLPVFSFEETTTNIDYSKYAGTTLNVYNWGEYIADGTEGSYNVNEEFYKLTGIRVNYEMFDTNEAMYAIIKAGGVPYDVIVPSDYMIEKMIAEDLLQKIDYSNIPNYKYIPDEYLNLAYDPANEYTVPYTGGRVGIIYNTTMVAPEDAAEQSWSLLFNEKYRGKILQFNNPRDAMATAQFYLGLDVNTTDTAKWDQALEKLKEQKPLLNSYVMDEIFNKMEAGEAAISSYYAGDFFTMYTENENLAFYYPKEGTNNFVDAMCIPKDSKNKEAAELYINFLLDPEVCKQNAMTICYECPNTAVMQDEEYLDFLREELHPDAYELLYGEKALETIPTQIYKNLDTETNNYLNQSWESLKTEGNGLGTTLYIVCGAIAVALIALIIGLAVSKHKKRIID
ncbi:MAG: spermidine/putrescine ABC transporter substrate-binding protein [Clostridiales bacterium]|nr:spermidine/putrescine ABC transporter substrate-binding protein [Clostridiales bacterium]